MSSTMRKRLLEESDRAVVNPPKSPGYSCIAAVYCELTQAAGRVRTRNG